MGLFLLPAVLGAAAVTSRQTVDLNGNGKIDQIRINFDENLNNDCTGITVVVSGYTVLGLADCNNESDKKFIVLLQENTDSCSYAQTAGCDTGQTPSVQITGNTSLKDSADTLIATDSSAETPSDGAAPVMTGVQATVGEDEITVNFSEPVGSQAGATGAVSSSVFSYNDVSGGSASAVNTQSAQAGQMIRYTLNRPFTESDNFTDILTIQSDSVFDAAGNSNSAKNAVLADRDSINFTAESSAAYALGTGPSAAPTLTIRNSPAADKITAAGDIRIRIPEGLAMLWDESAAGPTILGSAAERVSALPTFEDGGRTVVFDVEEDLQAGETLVISELRLKDFSAVSSGRLELVLAGNTIVQSTSIIEIYQPPDNPLENARAVPNFLNGGQGQIRLTNIDGKVRIRIFTARGRRIADVTRRSSGGSITLRPASGSSGPLRTGVYSILITDSRGNRKVLKLVSLGR